MDIRITPRKLNGAVTPPASKSMAHRAVLALALADGQGTCLLYTSPSPRDS